MYRVKKKTLMIIIFCFAMLFLVPGITGCAKQEDKEVSEDDDDEDENEGKQDKEKKKHKKKKKEKESLEEPEDEPTGLFASAFKAGEVENNGDWFVRVNDTVYYRIFNTLGLDRTTLMGNCIAETDDNLPSELKYYDLTTGDTGTICETTGTGKLLACAEGFLLSDVRSDKTVLIPMDGSQVNEYVDGIPKAVSDDGRYLVTRYNDGPDFGYYIYKDGKKTGNLEIGNEDFTEVYGFSGDNVIGMKMYYSEDKYLLCSYDPYGNCTELGNMDDYFDELYGYPELGQMLKGKDGTYLTVGFYDGTGHFLQSWELLKISPEQNNALEKVDTDGITSPDEFTMPKLYLDGSGKVNLSDHVKGDLVLSEVSYGDLIYYESPTDHKILKKNYIYEQTDYSYGCDFLQDAVVFDDDKAFIITAGTVRDELSDIGWRYAYSLTSLMFKEFSFADENLDDEGLVKEINTLEYLSSLGWNRADFEYDDMVGTWKMYSFEEEGYYGYAEDEGDIEKLTFESDGTVTYYRHITTGDQPEEERILHQVDSDGYGATFCYETEDGEDNKLHFDIFALDENRLDVNVTFYYEDGTPGGYYGIFLYD